MGNHRFRLSDMMPNAWFYKLRDMSKSRIQNPNSQKKLQQPSSTSQNNSRTSSSYQQTTSHKNIPYIINNYIEPPKKSSSKTKKPKRKTVYMPSPSKQSSHGQPDNSNFPVWLKPATVHHHFPDDEPDESEADTCHDSLCTCKLITSSEADDDIIIDVDDGRMNLNRYEELNVVLEQKLPPIRTKPTQNDTVLKAKKSKKQTARKSVSRVKIRANNRRRKSVKLGGDDDDDDDVKKKGLFYSESFAIVKASLDPERDFRESMMEMIVENNIRASKELEDLLACYLSLNSEQYHDLIVKAFEQIWFTMPQLDFD